MFTLAVFGGEMEKFKTEDALRVVERIAIESVIFTVVVGRCPN